MQRTPRTLIPNEGYEVGWVKARPFFNQPLTTQTGPGGIPLPNIVPNQNPTNEFDWASRGYALVIPASINPNQPLLLEDNFRNLLIIQNNSRATAPDTAPTLFMSLDGPVQSVTIPLNPGPGGVTYPYNAIALAPSEGLLLDKRILGNSLYFAWGAFVNTGQSAGVFGMCIYGRTLNSPPLSPAQKFYLGAGRGTLGAVSN